jgi:sugar lactone lactonase YvrE
MTACNTKFFNKIYRVDGQIDSWVDAETMSTLAYESDITEKKRRKIRRYHIDYEKGVVRAEKHGKVKTVPYEGEAALDPLAYVFRGRLLAGGPGSAFDLNLLTDRGVIVTGTRVGDLKRFKTADGKKDLLRVQPLTADGEMFSRKGEFIYWIDPDVNRKLYRLDFKLPFGRLLAKYTGPTDGPVDRRTEAEKADPGPPVEVDTEKE